MNRTINCPNCGVGNNVLPNMKKPKCRKCGKLLALSAPAEAPIAVASLAGSPTLHIHKLSSPPAPSGKTPGNSEKKRRSPKPKPSTVPEKSGVSPEVPKSEIDYEV